MCASGASPHECRKQDPCSGYHRSRPRAAKSFTNDLGAVRPFETRASPIRLCRKRSFGTCGQWPRRSQGFVEKPRPGGRQAARSASRCALQGQRLGAVRLRDAGVADQHVSQTAVCDTRAKAPPGTRRRVSYSVSDSMSRIRQEKQQGTVPRSRTGHKNLRSSLMTGHRAARSSTSSAHWFRLLPDSSAASAAWRCTSGLTRNIIRPE